MSNTEKLKTAGLNADGTSRLSVTKKKKSKSRWIVPAIIGGAALFAGIGGMGASSGQSWMSSFLSSGKKVAGSIGSKVGSLFSSGSERRFEEEKRQFDLTLAAEYDIAGAKIDQEIREGALAGTYMGATNPIFGNLEGVKSNTTPGYIPSKPANIAGIHPVSGGLISQAENTA